MAHRKIVGGVHTGRAGDLGRTLTMPEPLSHTRAETSPSSAMMCVCSGVRGGVARQRMARRARRFGVATREAKARRALNGEKLIRRAAPETRRRGACVAQTAATTACDAPFVLSSRVSGSRGTCVARWGSEAGLRATWSSFFRKLARKHEPLRSAQQRNSATPSVVAYCDSASSQAVSARRESSSQAEIGTHCIA